MAEDLGVIDEVAPPGSGGGASAALIWEDTALPLKDFASKYPVPNVIKVTKGQYRNLGVAKSVANELYLHSIRTSKKVLAEGVRVKEGKRITTVDQKFSLPVTYQGWFELLSEDGKAVKPLQTVAELARVLPQRCLVRESIKVSLRGAQVDGSGEVTAGSAGDRTRVLATGEQLSIVGDIVGPSSPASGKFTGQPGRRKFLKAIDQQGEAVFLPLDQKGLFSPIAGHANISGVHNLRALVEKFRLPIVVRLVHGIIPSRLDKASFSGVFRLMDVYTDETAFVCPLRRDARMVPLPTSEPLKVVGARNYTAAMRHADDARFYHARCGRMIASYLNSIHVHVGPTDPALMFAGPGAPGRPRPDQSFHKQAHADDLPASTDKAPAGRAPTTNGVTEEDILFEEIDDIYQFVRDGGRPPPPRPRPPHLRGADGSPPPTSPAAGPVPNTGQEEWTVSTGPAGSRPGSGGGAARVSRPTPGGAATAVIRGPGSVDIVNSSPASASPEDTSPATTLSYSQRHNDHWEEPIYERLGSAGSGAGVGGAAHGGGGSGVSGAAGATRRPSVPSGNPATAAAAAQSASSEQPARHSPSRMLQGTVENLRQMYKKPTPTSSPGEVGLTFPDDDEHDEDEVVPQHSASGHVSAASARAIYHPGVKMTKQTMPTTPPPTTATSMGGHPKPPFPKRHSVPSLYQTEQIANDEFKSVHDRIASINQATNGYGGGGPVTGTGRAGPRPDLVEAGPGQQRRYIRANPTAVQGNAGRGQGTIPNNQFVAVARVGPSAGQGTGRLMGPDGSGSTGQKAVGVSGQKGGNSQKGGISQRGISQKLSGQGTNDMTGRDKADKSAAKPTRTAYSRVENLRRKLQGLYL